MFSLFLSSYRNTRESLGELEKALETLTYSSCFHGISHSPKLPLVFLVLHVACFSINSLELYTNNLIMKQVMVTMENVSRNVRERDQDDSPNFFSQTNCLQ